MAHSAFDARGGLGSRLKAAALVATGAVAGLTLAAPVRGQATEVAPTEIFAREMVLSRDEAALRLELGNGESLELALRDGRAFYAGRPLGDAQRNGPLDRSWRELLDRAIDAPTNELPDLLSEWEPPAGEPGATLATAIQSFLTGVEMPAVPAPAVATAAAADIEAEVEAQIAREIEQATGSGSDSVDRLNTRIEELERLVDEAQATEQRGRGRGGDWLGPFRHIAHSVGAILSILVTYTVIFGIGVATVFFGGRRYLEGVADTARYSTTRSLLVGLAATFLVVPAFILGIIALAISIVGIPGLIVWVPLFPLATGLAILLGYLGVAHAAGESLAERRLYASDWFKRGNSYYFLMTGLALLASLFIAAQVVGIAGPWFGFFSGLLCALGVVLTWAALSIGLGAVLISRGGTRPTAPDASASERDMFAEHTNG